MGGAEADDLHVTSRYEPLVWLLTFRSVLDGLKGRIGVETTHRRAAAYERQIASGRFPAMNPKGCQS